MKFGINTLLWTAGFDESHLSLLPPFKQWGFDGVEIARFAFDSFPAARIRRAVLDAGLEPIFCSALTGQTSLVSDNAATRAQASAFLKQGIETAAELGAKVFLGPFCAPVGLLPGRRRTQDEWKRAVEGLQALGSTLEACDVTLAVEPLNRFETYFLNTCEDAYQLCEQVSHPKIGVLFDTFHANIEEKNAAVALQTLRTCLAHVHACENDRGAPGSGHVQWPQIFAELLTRGYDGWVCIESFGSNIPEIAAAACIWRDLAPSAEALARDGLSFLKAGLTKRTSA